VSCRRQSAVAGALLVAALAIAGCGVGAGADVGEVSLTVTRDFGAESLLPRVEESAVESDTVMRVLDRNAEVSTRYGGGYVSAIEGLAEAVRGGQRYDWFFYVDGVESPIGAAEFSLRGGEAIWWDYRDWSSASRVSAVVGSFPHPLVGGYEGERRPVSLECRVGAVACATARRRLSAAGVALAGGRAGDSLRILVGTWASLREDRAAAQIERGPQVSGVFADFARRAGGFELFGLDEHGDPVRSFGPGAGLVAATRRFDAPPVWLITGATASGVRAAVGLLDAAHLRNHYAVATEGGQEMPLPLEAR
jgi:hypothetical protein